MKAIDILKKYPQGCKIIDPYGNIQTIRNQILKVCLFKEPGTLILGGQYIFCGKNKKWAEIVVE